MKSFMRIGANQKHICACSAYMDPGINNLKIRDMKEVIECGECDGCGEVMNDEGEWIACGLCDGAGEISI